ncbi:DNA polymerase zeta [Metarhizium acridum]|nr:DNA polymerase zeta [Metarhizium acridum]
MPERKPQYGERVPYWLSQEPPGHVLIDRSVAPEDLLANPHWQLGRRILHLKNLIPPLERIFNLVGANVRQWYDEMPRSSAYAGRQTSREPRKMTLESVHALDALSRL